MKSRTVLAMTTALLLAGSAATTASAYDRYYDNGRYGYYDRYDHRMTSQAWDRDCDGVPDRHDRYVRYDAHDADCDGIPNRYDRRYDSRYSSRSRYDHRWSVGAYLPRDYYGSSYYVDYRPYRLPPPPYGYRWNRVGNDVYLISTRNGMVIEVRYDLFH